MKKSLLLTLACLPALFGTSCNDDVRQLNVYFKKGVVAKRINVRYFKDSPNVPYISVKDFYKEFYKTDITKQRNRNTGYFDTYYSKAYECIMFGPKVDRLWTNGFRSFEYHPDFKSTTGKLFIEYDKTDATHRETKEINLADYSIKTYERQKEAYVPLTLLSDISGGPSGYDIAYNGKDIYVFDYYGYLGDPTDASTFGTDYTDPLNNLNEERPEDLINYNYNELCLVFDNFRGYTKQLILGDEDLLNLGLDKLLSTKHPKIKEYLLSKNKSNYYEGLYALFNGLNDGGHTGLIFNFDAFKNAIERKSEQDFVNLQSQASEVSTDKVGVRSSFKVFKMNVLGVKIADKKYYYYDNTNKTAIIGFDSFDLDIEGWDNYYNGKGEVPLDSDTYAYVRNKMYQAKVDGAENLVLDLTTNGGGSSYALEGVLGLFNGAKAYINFNDVVGGFTSKDNHLIDVNLDGTCNELDEQEVAKFNFNVGVLTSKYAFSCGNLLPFNMKELGYKILGEKTGGGSCAISRDSTADGIPYAHSSYLCLTDQSGENIDGGVEVDFAIERPSISSHLYDASAFFDTQSISNYLSEAYTH